MKAKEIEVGSVYIAKVSGQITLVRVLRLHPIYGWEVRNLRSGRVTHFRTAGRFRAAVDVPPTFEVGGTVRLRQESLRQHTGTVTGFRVLTPKAILVQVRWDTDHMPKIAPLHMLDVL